LKICLHIDETKWKKNRKLERVTFRILNFAEAGDFSRMTCHGDTDIFTLGHFYVKKESFKTLKVRALNCGCT